MGLTEILRINTKKWVLIGFGLVFLGWNIYAYAAGAKTDATSAALYLWLCSYPWTVFLVGLGMGGFLWMESVQKAWERLRERLRR